MTINHVAVLLAGLVVGCSEEALMPNEPEPSVQSFLTLSPADGESSVRLDAPIILAFTKPVDRMVVERGFHLINEKAMADSLCPVSSTMDHGNMMNTMADSAKMHHVDRYHSTPGKFVWNAESTFCSFRPDSLLMSREVYMIHFDREATQMMERRFGIMGKMSGHGEGMMSGEMMFHFSTLDTTRSGSGHSAHH